MSTFSAVWFQDGPPTPHVIGDEESCLRYALGDGRGWAVTQERVHPRQVAVRHELRVQPAGMFYSMAYRLTQSGAELSRDLRALTVDRTERIEDILGTGEICIVTVNDTHLLGCEWQFDQHKAVVTIHRGNWLAALRPAESGGWQLAETDS